MTQQFKFGDMVKSREYIALSNKSLFFFRYSDEESDLAECLEQDGTFHFLKVEDLELVPHPDTVRLDFVIKNRFVATFSDDFDDDYLIVKGQIPDPAKTFGRGFSPRQAIDNAMQQEHENDE